jgi:SNF2 family DNA or RNA helicase
MTWSIKTSLLHHQVDAVEFFKFLKVGFLKGDMGTGKTLAILALACEKQAKYSRIVWVAPHSTLLGLRQQVEEHTQGSVPFESFSYEAIQSSDNAYLAFSEAVKNAFLLLDESHFIKNKDAKRTQRITNQAKKAKYRYAMSGTPIGLDLYDYFSQLYALSWKIWKYPTWRCFEQFHIFEKIVEGSFGKRKVMRTWNQKNLVNRLKPYLFEFKKEEVLKLPMKKNYTERFTSDASIVRQYHEIKNEILEQYAQYGITESVIYRLVTALHQLIGQDLNRIERLDEVVEAVEGKVIVWIKYRAELDLIQECTRHKAIYMDGRNCLNERHDLVNEFASGDAKMLVTNQAVGGTGLNLQFCNTQVFYNQSWDYILRQQAEDRIHRIGQKHECHYIDLQGDLKIEKMLHACLCRKKRLKEFIGELFSELGTLKKKELIEKVGELI